MGQSSDHLRCGGVNEVDKGLHALGEGVREGAHCAYPCVLILIHREVRAEHLIRLCDGNLYVQPLLRSARRRCDPILLQPCLDCLSPDRAGRGQLLHLCRQETYVGTTRDMNAERHVPAPC